jgi:hypothetical protein
MHFLYTDEYGTLKLVKVIVRRDRGKRVNKGEGEPNLGTKYVYIEISQ